MGETQMGKYGFSSWTLHMASIIIFSTLWGLGFKEWKGAGAPAMRFLTLALDLAGGIDRDRRPTVILSARRARGCSRTARSRKQQPTHGLDKRKRVALEQQPFLLSA